MYISEIAPCKIQYDFHLLQLMDGPRIQRSHQLNSWVAISAWRTAHYLKIFYVPDLLYFSRHAHILCL